jgi:hypothetical protein
MNPDQEKLRAILDEVLPPSSELCGPGRDDVSAMLQREHNRRRRLRRGAALLAILALGSVSLLWRNERTAGPSVAHVPTQPASIFVREVNDDQLLSLLQDTPVALMEWPNGERSLLVLDTSKVPAR